MNIKGNPSSYYMVFKTQAYFFNAGFWCAAPLLSRSLLVALTAVHISTLEHDFLLKSKCVS